VRRLDGYWQTTAKQIALAFAVLIGPVGFCRIRMRLRRRSVDRAAPTLRQREGCCGRGFFLFTMFLMMFGGAGPWHACSSLQRRRLTQRVLTVFNGRGWAAGSLRSPFKQADHVQEGRCPRMPITGQIG